MKNFKRIVPLLAAVLISLGLFAGCAGPVGTGVTTATVDSSGDLSIVLSDGSTVTAGNVEGPQGPTGPQGPQGPQGVQGPAGESGTGISSASVNDAGELILTLTDGQTVNAGSVVGPEGPSGPQGPAGTITGNLDFTTTIEKIQPVLVRIDTDIASGSGVIVNASGYVLTNQHVIDQASSIQATLMDDSVLSAQVVSADSNLDIAVLKLSSDRTDFPVADIGSSNDVQVGEYVIAGGFPLGEVLPGPATFTEGIVSAMRYDSSVDITYIQMDSPISPGNSGGGLFNRQGVFIGIPSYDISERGVDAEDLNLAIPVDIAMPMIESAIGG